MTLHNILGDDLHNSGAAIATRSGSETNVAGSTLTATSRSRRTRTDADLDDPPAGAWFSEAIDLGWTRDPFDRLLVAHARLRGWRLASSDGPLQDRLHERERLQI
jgi:hypothetical protein